MKKAIVLPNMDKPGYEVAVYTYSNKGRIKDIEKVEDCNTREDAMGKALFYNQMFHKTMLFRCPQCHRESLMRRNCLRKHDNKMERLELCLHCKFKKLVPFVAMLLVFFVSSPAFAYKPEEIVKAIYHAEGGAKAQFKYGIRSIKTNNPAKICLNTVKNQMKRHAKHKCGKPFLVCLRDRYCPIKGKLSKAEIRLNKNWLKNVNYYLVKGGKNGKDI